MALDTVGDKLVSEVSDRSASCHSVSSTTLLGLLGTATVPEVLRLSPDPGSLQLTAVHPACERLTSKVRKSSCKNLTKSIYSSNKGIVTSNKRIATSSKKLLLQ